MKTTLIALLLVSSSVNAAVICKTDSFNNTRCYNTETGYRSQSITDSFGNSHNSDNQGNTSFCNTDSFGRTVCQ